MKIKIRFVLIFIITNFFLVNILGQSANHTKTNYSAITPLIENFEILNVAQFRNGKELTYAQSSEEWTLCTKKKIPCWCYNQGDSTKNKLYNLYALNDVDEICPIGYEVVSDEIILNYINNILVDTPHYFLYKLQNDSIMFTNFINHFGIRLDGSRAVSSKFEPGFTNLWVASDANAILYSIRKTKSWTIQREVKTNPAAGANILIHPISSKVNLSDTTQVHSAKYDSIFGNNGILFLNLNNYGFRPQKSILDNQNNTYIFCKTYKESIESGFQIIKILESGEIDGSFDKNNQISKPDDSTLLLCDAIIDSDSTYLYALLDLKNKSVIINKINSNGILLASGTNEIQYFTEIPIIKFFENSNSRNKYIAIYTHKASKNIIYKVNSDLVYNKGNYPIKFYADNIDNYFICSNGIFKINHSINQINKKNNIVIYSCIENDPSCNSAVKHVIQSKFNEEFIKAKVLENNNILIFFKRRIENSLQVELHFYIYNISKGEIEKEWAKRGNFSIPGSIYNEQTMSQNCNLLFTDQHNNTYLSYYGLVGRYNFEGLDETFCNGGFYQFQGVKVSTYDNYAINNKYLYHITQIKVGNYYKLSIQRLKLDL